MTNIMKIITFYQQNIVILSTMYSYRVASEPFFEVLYESVATSYVISTVKLELCNTPLGGPSPAQPVSLSRAWDDTTSPY